MVTAPSKGADAPPDGWRLVRLGEVATLQRGVDLPVQDRLNGAIPVYGSNGVLGYHANASQEGPGVITGRSGSIGLVYYSEGPYWPLNTTLYVRDFHGNSERYIFHFLSHLGLERFAASTGVPSLNRNFVHPHLVAMPPLPEQRAIATVLDAIDDAIERTEAVIAATERLRDALLHDLLMRGVPGWHSEWRDVPGLGTIPADWEVVRLGDVAEVERGKFAHRPRNEPRFYGGEIPFIQTGDIVQANGRIRDHTQTLNGAGLAISRLFPAGTIVMTIAANIGETAIATYPVAFPDSLVGITARQVDTPFLEYFLRTQQERLRAAAPASAQKNINLENLRPMTVPYPSLEEQHTIAGILDSLDEAIERARAEREALQPLKASASDALLSGRIRIL